MGRLLYAVAISTTVWGATAALAAEPRAVVQGEMTPELRAAVERVVGQADRPIDNRFEARRRARAAAEDAIALLRSEGYYANAVEPDVSESDPPRALVQITPGPQFHLKQPEIAWQGQAPATVVQDAARTALGLSPGAAGRAADVLAAEGRILAGIQSLGHADAAAEPREVIVDHADSSLLATFRIAAGPVVRLGALDIAADGGTDRTFLVRLVPWSAGEAYNPEDVAELERRLLDTGVYDSVTVALASADKASGAGLRPVIVSLAPRKPRSIEGSASWATREGIGLSARWTQFNRLGRADTIALTGQVSDRDSRTGIELALPHWRRPQQTLRGAASAYRVRTDAYDETGIGVLADITRRYGRTSYFTLGASTDLSRTTEPTPSALTALGRDLVTVRGLSDLVLDRSDDPLQPSRGFRVSARVEPTLILGDTNLPYLRAIAQGSYYLKLDKQAHTVIAARLRVGRIINGTVDQIPASQRFYAGGGGSVRGFSYQGVGPRLSDGSPRGGLSLVETSFEVRRQVTSRWGFAAFVDAGAVGSSGPVDLGDSSLGAGFGIRYNLGFAPIRFDIATPVAGRNGQPPFQIYVSIGQSF